MPAANQCQIVLGDACMEITIEPVSQNTAELLPKIHISGVSPTPFRQKPAPPNDQYWIYRFDTVTVVRIYMSDGRWFDIELQEITNQPTWNNGNLTSLNQAVSDINAWLIGVPPVVQYLLDQYPGAKCGYSVSRQLKTGLTDALLLRNSSGSTLLISYVNGEVDEAAMVTHCAGSYGTVQELYDSSGNGFTLTNANPATQPMIVDNSGNVIKINAKPAMFFNLNKSLKASTASDWTFMTDGTDHAAHVLMYLVDPTVQFNCAFGTSTNGTTSVTGSFLSRVRYLFMQDCPRSVITNSLGDPNTSVIDNVGDNFSIPLDTQVLISVFNNPTNAIALERSTIVVNNGSTQKNNIVLGTPDPLAPANPLQMGGFGDYTETIGYIQELIIYPFI